MRLRGKLSHGPPWLLKTARNSKKIDIWPAIDRFFQSVDGKRIMHRQNGEDENSYEIVTTGRSEVVFCNARREDDVYLLDMALGQFTDLIVEIDVEEGMWLKIRELELHSV